MTANKYAVFSWAPPFDPSKPRPYIKYGARPARDFDIDTLPATFIDVRFVSAPNARAALAQAPQLLPR